MNTIEYNGKNYTEEEAKQFIQETVVTAWERIKELINEVANNIVELFQKQHYPLGYKRKFKRAELEKYEKMSYGKSNNWRKTHGLPLIRNR